MIKNECKIVRDLFPNYIENQISTETKEFIDVHLNDCNECAKLLDNIKNKDLDIKTHFENKKINFLKKYNTRVFISKISIIFLLCIIIFAGSIGGFRYIKGKKSYTIISQAYSKKEELFGKNNLNLVLKINENNESMLTYSFYGECYKYERKYIKENTSVQQDIIEYCKYDTNKLHTINIQVNNKENLVTTAGFYSGEYTPKDFQFSYLNALWSRDIMSCYKMNVLEEKHNNIDCYVLEDYHDNYATLKLYIDTNTMLPIRYENINLNGNIQWFVEYYYSVGTVKKEDLDIRYIEDYDGVLSNKNTALYRDTFEEYMSTLM